MRDLSPPLLEIGFYSARVAETETFSKLVHVLLNMGAEFTGVGYAYQFPEAKDVKFTSIHDYDLEPVVIETTAHFEAHMESVKSRLMQVQMKGTTRATRDVKELVGYVGISTDAVGRDRHPVSLLADGDVICSPLHRQLPQRARAIGENLYHRFLELVSTLNPTYAAITCEYPLECPSDLRRDPRSLAFRDFYVSRTDLGRPAVDAVRKIFDGAYTEEIADGLYVSSFEYLNPSGRGMEAEAAQWRSVDVARVIASLPIP